MNYMDYLQKLDAVFIQKRRDIENMSQSSGGWEGWLQGEMFNKWNCGQVLREQPVWGDGREIDFWFPVTKFGVEIKCLGLNRVKSDHDIISKRTSTYTSFANDVLKDVKKVAELPQGATGMAIVVIPTWLPEEAAGKVKSELAQSTFAWQYMGNNGFYVGINRYYYL
jgi:hypothetical protein